MASHTSGPWTVEYRKPMSIDGNIHRVIDGERYPAAFVPAWDSPGPGEIDGTEEAIANARLIASAPMLLEALQNMLGAFDSPVRRLKMPGSFEDECVASARATVAAATGEK